MMWLHFVARPQLYQQNANVMPPEKDFLITALDVLSGMAEGLDQDIESLVANSNLLAMLYECMQVLASACPLFWALLTSRTECIFRFPSTEL
jgi:transportin-1